MLGVRAQALRESAEPIVADILGQRERQQETERRGALGGEIRQVHPQRLARHVTSRIVGKKMHAADDRVGLEHEVATGRRLDESGVVGKTKRARMRRQRLKEARDQPVLARHFIVGGHGVTRRLVRIHRRAVCAPADRARR